MKPVSEITLFALCEQIRRQLAASMPSYVWVRAEINGLKETASGHCYLDLIDKPSAEAPLRAQARAVIWSGTWRLLRPFFESVTGRSLAVGMQVLLRVQVQYSELYGLTLVVQDLDPSCTLGEEELLRQRVIERLKHEGMFEMNATLARPRLLRRLAVISSETAAGYLDFVRHLSQNEYGYRFVHRLYPSLMQGAEAPADQIRALDQIAQEQEEYLAAGRLGYDAVLILRGGGSKTDLRCFDDYELAAHVAQFPLPVLTAIGHEQDVHIVDLVAAVHLKTPTALAHYLIDLYQQEEAMLLSWATRLELAIRNKLSGEHAVLDRFGQRLEAAFRLRMTAERAKLELLGHRLEKGNPKYLLEQGYALALLGQHRIRGVNALSEGNEVELVFADGQVTCRVLKIQTSNSE